MVFIASRNHCVQNTPQSFDAPTTTDPPPCPPSITGRKPTAVPSHRLPRSCRPLGPHWAAWNTTLAFRRNPSFAVDHTGGANVDGRIRFRSRLLCYLLAVEQVVPASESLASAGEGRAVPGTFVPSTSSHQDCAISYFATLHYLPYPSYSLPSLHPCLVLLPFSSAVLPLLSMIP